MKYIFPNYPRRRQFKTAHGYNKAYREVTMNNEITRVVNNATKEGFYYISTVQDDEKIDEKADPAYGDEIRTIIITLKKRYNNTQAA